MSEVRKQIRLSFPPDLASVFDKAKSEAQTASGVTLSDTQFALGLIRRALST
jgi:hypothetical protein